MHFNLGTLERHQRAEVRVAGHPVRVHGVLRSARPDEVSGLLVRYSRHAGQVSVGSACRFKRISRDFLTVYGFVDRAGIFKHTQSICKAIIADTLPRERQVSAYGHTAGLGMLGFVVGPTIGGHIIEYPNGFLLVCYLTSVLFLINVGKYLLAPHDAKYEKCWFRLQR